MCKPRKWLPVRQSSSPSWPGLDPKAVSLDSIYQVGETLSFRTRAASERAQCDCLSAGMSSRMSENVQNSQRLALAELFGCVQISQITVTRYLNVKPKPRGTWQVESTRPAHTARRTR